MNRKKLERYLKQFGCTFHHCGGEHDIWARPDEQRTSAIPRHKGINPFTVRSICKDYNSTATGRIPSTAATCLTSSNSTRRESRSPSARRRRRHAPGSRWSSIPPPSATSPEKETASLYHKRFEKGFSPLGESVARLLDKLSSLGLMTNTIVAAFGLSGMDTWRHGIYRGRAMAIDPYADLCWMPLLLFNNDEAARRLGADGGGKLFPDAAFTSKKRWQ